MAVAKISKIEIYGLHNKKEAIVELLQNEGALQLETTQAEGEDYQTTKELADTEYKLAGVKFSLSFLKTFYIPPKRSVSEKLAEMTKNYSNDEINKIISKSNYKNTISKTQELESILNEAINRITKQENQARKLQQWKKLKTIPKNNLASAEIYLGEVKSNRFALLEENLTKASREYQLDEINETGGFTQFMLVFNKEITNEITKILHTLDAKEAEIPETKNDIPSTLNKIRSEIEKLKKDITQTKKELTELANNIPELQIVHDSLEWEKERENVKGKLADTEYTFSIKGWIDSQKIEVIKTKLQKITPQFEIISKDPEENDNVPVLLKNKDLVTPFEFITHLYGSPKYNEPDPSPYLAPFFVLFFGLCLTDAGYGLVLVGLIIAAIKIFKIPKPNQKLFKTLLWGGVLTVIAGALFGGWFGIQLDNLPNSVIKDFLIGIRIIDPMKDPLKILILSLGIGFLQVIVGLTVGMVWNIRHGKVKDGIYDYGFWAGLLISLMLWYLASSGVFLAILATPLKIILLAFVVGLILTQGRRKKSILGKFASGLLSLYGIVGYGSDILSYSRLLALGLSTGVVAMVVNIMGGLVNEMIPYVGWLVALFILIGGHIFNIGINVLGAYIHSMRLQFVEFFPKFMEGGGDIFSPFKKQTKYIRLNNSEESKYQPMAEIINKQGTDYN